MKMEAKSPIFRVSDLKLATAADARPLTFTITDSLTLLKGRREDSVTSLGLVLAGRMNPLSGTVELSHDGASYLRTRDRFARIALAGATEIDSLERSVSAEQALRDVLGWSHPWWRRGTREAFTHSTVSRWLDPLGLDIDPHRSVGKLSTLDRFRLRILLGLVSRPNAAALVVDDLDQLRSRSLTERLVANLSIIAEELPVVALTVNEGTLDLSSPEAVA